MVVVGDVLGNPRPYLDLDNGFMQDRQALQQDVDNTVRTLNEQIYHGQQKYSAPCER